MPTESAAGCREELNEEDGLRHHDCGEGKRGESDRGQHDSPPGGDRGQKHADGHAHQAVPQQAPRAPALHEHTARDRAERRRHAAMLSSRPSCVLLRPK